MAGRECIADEKWKIETSLMNWSSGDDCVDVILTTGLGEFWVDYRVGQVVCHMGFVDFDLDVPPFCLAAQPINP